jgi:hypothetical protein
MCERRFGLSQAIVGEVVNLFFIFHVFRMSGISTAGVSLQTTGIRSS